MTTQPRPVTQGDFVLKGPSRSIQELVAQREMALPPPHMIDLGAALRVPGSASNGARVTKDTKSPPRSKEDIVAELNDVKVSVMSDVRDTLDRLEARIKKRKRQLNELNERIGERLARVEFMLAGREANEDDDVFGRLSLLEQQRDSRDKRILKLEEAMREGNAVKTKEVLTIVD